LAGRWRGGGARGAPVPTCASLVRPGPGLGLGAGLGAEAGAGPGAEAEQRAGITWRAQNQRQGNSSAKFLVPPDGNNEFKRSQIEV
jgi:hypothetical protein